MRADDRALADLAASVADGEAVDWPSAESRAERGDRRLIQHLRLVESIATLYRSLPAAEPLTGGEPLADPDAGAEARRAVEPAGPRWGRLVMLDRIGEGTSGEVYRAWDSELHREVALKLLHDEDTANHDRAHARMLEEARRLARIRHPHVVQVYGAEQHDGRVGLWMELVRGESLEQGLKTRGPSGAREAALTGLDVCASLAAVHGAGLLHRDVKAQNVMRESGGRLVLMDFGTGEELRRDTGSPRMVGTPLYLAPEIFLGRAASVQSDLYSVGVLLFYLATGEFPVMAASMEQLALAHAHGQRRRLRDLRPDLPEAFVRVVERALHNEPARRYASAGEMEAALREALDVPGRTAEAPPVPAVVVEKSAPLPWSRRGMTIGAIALLCVVVALIVWSRGGVGNAPVAPATSGIRSIAVLPMTDLSGSAQAPYLADGLHDQLITTLGQIQSLRVTSRTSVMQFKGSRASAGEIAKTLGVDAVLESTVSSTGGGTTGSPGRVRVNASLMTAGASTPLWSRTFERPLGDLLALEAEVARAIAASVRATITPGESARLSRPQQTNPAAEEAYFQGRRHLEQYGSDRARRALEAFDRAITLDPQHAAAHAGAARAYLSLGFNGDISQPEARASALAELQKAVALDENLPEARAALADVKFYYDWDWVGAEAEYRRAIDLSPSFTYAQRRYASYLAAARRLDEAVQHASEAQDLDPLSAEAAATHGMALYYRRDYPAARATLRRALELEPGSAAALIVMGRVDEAEGQFEEALKKTTQALQLAGGGSMPLRVQVVCLEALAGRKEQARRNLEDLQQAAAVRKLRISAEYLAYAHIALGDHEQALALLEHAIDERDPALLWLAVDPRVDSLRSEPRFAAVLDKLGQKEQRIRKP